MKTIISLPRRPSSSTKALYTLDGIAIEVYSKFICITILCIKQNIIKIIYKLYRLVSKVINQKNQQTLKSRPRGGAQGPILGSRRPGSKGTINWPETAHTPIWSRAKMYKNAPFPGSPKMAILAPFPPSLCIRPRNQCIGFQPYFSNNLSKVHSI